MKDIGENLYTQKELIAFAEFMAKEPDINIDDINRWQKKNLNKTNEVSKYALKV